MASVAPAPQNSAPLSLSPEEYGAGGSLLDLNYVLAVIRRNLWLIVVIVAAALAVAVAATLLATPQYTATATMQVNETSQQVLDSEDADPMASGWDYDRFLQTQVDVLTSRSLAERVTNALNLAEDAAFFEAFGVASEAIPETEEARSRLAIGLVRGHLGVDVPRNTRIVPLRFSSGSPAMSAKIVNSYAEQLIQSNLQRKFDSSAYARDFVSDQLSAAKERLEESERALNDYSRTTGLIRVPTGSSDETNAGQGTSITTASLVQLNQSANQAKAARIAAEARWNAVSRADLFSSQPVLDDETVSALMARKGQVEAMLAEERATRLEDHPAVEAREAELAKIQAELRRVANNVRQSVRADYDAARAAEAQLMNQVNALKSDTLSEQDTSVQFALLAREADTNRQLYEELLQRFKELNAAAGISASNISIIDRATVPSVPSSPSLFVNLAIGLVLGLFAAAGIVFLRTELDDSIRVPEDVEQKLDLNLLGVVPVQDGSTIDEALEDPKTAISEAYSSLRGNLMYATASGLPRTMLITSSQPSEGKSTTSRALAGSFARIGRKVVLVDADIRRPTLHRVAGISNDIGLTTLLTGQADISQAITMNEAYGYAQLPAGPIPPAPSELLASGRMQEVIDELAEKFDVVIVDCSPVLGLADAPMLSVLVDGVVFVAEAGKGHRGLLKSSLRRLRSMRPNILGAVLTKFDPDDAANSYSSYYGYSYYEYRDDREPVGS